MPMGLSTGLPPPVLLSPLSLHPVVTLLAGFYVQSLEVNSSGREMIENRWTEIATRRQMGEKKIHFYARD